ncbi:glycosyltransferase family 2 protein [Rariglobus hedericola]|uniref:Glycosyltransferase family 2 protein n=1 Tax=Rariglobus hedericola TaxID=2597822 RepID=A0A556QNJ4_9BACT|nr:glycosyltransferase family 2 protein [Rariglobus hedericola]TSJ78197.1 glycosyltransferase family 2 protein [Rariglobus hedericola]
MTSAPSPELVLIVPVYNEEETIIPVLTEWRQALAPSISQFVILVIDDGSTDGTSAKLASLDWPELRVHTHTNRGHGQSCLVGYRQAAALGASHVFQIDSDGQCDPAGFPDAWSNRSRATAIYGRRTTRDDGWARKLVTRVLRLSLRWMHSTRLNDTNVPFRLYPATLAAKTADRIPPSFELANIAMALLLEPQGFIELPIHFRDRAGGHASVRWTGFAQKALRLFRDLKTIRHERDL